MRLGIFGCYMLYFESWCWVCVHSTLYSLRYQLIFQVILFNYISDASCAAVLKCEFFLYLCVLFDIRCFKSQVYAVARTQFTLNAHSRAAFYI
jgi:hypothetical protein